MRCPALVRQVVVAGAEVDRGRQRGVVDVLRVAGAVAVGIDAHHRPGRRDELHRADRPVEGGSSSYCPASVSAIRVVPRRAVEREAVDAGPGEAVAVQRVAAAAAVVGLDPADRGDQLPGQVAGRVGGVDDGLGALVGGERGGGDAGRGESGDGAGARDAPAVAARAPVPRLSIVGHARRHPDRPGRDPAAVGQGALEGLRSATAVPPPAPATLIVQAAESTARGTSAMACCARPKRRVAIVAPRPSARLAG